MISPVCLCQEEVCVDVLKAYVSLLIRDQQADLVASYVSQLPAEVATAQYAAFLETVTQPELRPRCLQLATDAGETEINKYEAANREWKRAIWLIVFFPV